MIATPKPKPSNNHSWAVVVTRGTQQWAIYACVPVRKSAEILRDVACRLGYRDARVMPWTAYLAHRARFREECHAHQLDAHLDFMASVHGQGVRQSILQSQRGSARDRAGTGGHRRSSS